MEESFFDVGDFMRYTSSRREEINTMKIFCVSWNSQSKVFCGRKNQRDIGGWITSTPCYQPDFMGVLRDKIEACDIFVFSSQEDDSISQLHTWVEDDIKESGFKLIARSELLGYGVTTLTTGRSRGLRMSVFMKEKYIPSDKSTHKHVCGGTLQTYITQNKGGIGVLVTIKDNTFLFCNLHLPFKSKTLKELTMKEGSKDKYMERLRDIETQTKCLNDVMKDFISGRQIDSVIIMGDLNYRLSPYSYDKYDRPINNKDIILNMLRGNEYNKVYRQYDELRKEMKDGNIDIDFSEGVNNVGITFPPTCKMYNNKPGSIHRVFPIQYYISEGEDNRCYTYFDDSCYKMGYETYRLPSFCDRILYTNLNKENDIECLEYKSLTSKMINTVDHNLIYGTYKVSF